MLPDCNTICEDPAHAQASMTTRLKHGLRRCGSCEISRSSIDCSSLPVIGSGAAIGSPIDCNTMSAELAGEPAFVRLFDRAHPSS